MQKVSSIVQNEINETQLESSDLPTQEVQNRALNKGFFFLVALIASFFVIGFLFLINTLSPDTLAYISSILEKLPFLELKISDQIVSELKFPNPVTNTIFLANLVFIAFILFDSFNNEDKTSQMVKIRREDGSFFYTYRNNQAHFSESSSLSFAIHSAILLLILLSLLLSFQPKPKVKINSIEFIPTQIVSKKPPPKKTKRKAAKQSIDQGKHNPKKKVTPATKAGKPKPSRPKTKPQPPKQQKPAPKKPTAAPKSAPKAAKPKAAPKPQVKSRPRPSPKPSPKPKVALRGSQQTADPYRNTSSLPKLLNYNSGATSTKGGTGTNTAPAPKTSTGSGRGSEIVSQLGSIPRAPDSLGQSGSYGNPGNPGQNPYADRPPSVAAQADVNFGPYMSALQRKIKRAWKPPRGTESNRIVVTFVVLKDGHLADLKIVTASPSPIANTAALKAVSAAAPFDPLPVGAGDSVDIEFTFDYNVFQKTRY